LVANLQSPTTPETRHRVLFLGASNLALGFHTIVEETHRVWGTPLDLIFAHGHGRSYGGFSNVLGRQLPAILHCRLWKELARRPQLPTTAFVTDIGTDLLYMQTPVTLSGWLDTTLERLSSFHAEICISTLPETSVNRVNPAIFYLLRSILFPKSTLTLEQAHERIAETNALIIQLAEKHDAKLFQHSPDCYGIDPIHIRRGKRRVAWRKALLTGREQQPLADEYVRCRARRLRPRYRRRCGVPQRVRQPLMRLNGGTAISLY
jgi:hypothetical protein